MTGRDFNRTTTIETSFAKTWKDTKVFQTITLIALVFFWGGYCYSIFQGNRNNISSYSLVILIFSVLNMDVLFAGKRAETKFLDVLAKCEGVVFFVWVIATILQLLLR